LSSSNMYPLPPFFPLRPAEIFSPISFCSFDSRGRPGPSVCSHLLFFRRQSERCRIAVFFSFELDFDLPPLSSSYGRQWLISPLLLFIPRPTSDRAKSTCQPQFFPCRPNDRFNTRRLFLLPDARVRNPRYSFFIHLSSASCA